ncbi:hotdog fold thioesterase [Pseudalkalibacillus caeni]|uniref:Hotdog fold thioesterase n=1 Tax=Exobacillus caeni TaxID=2574798 RepID=A0A5R9F461_9BACL|nr:hotdog fold thioesterase [Pseudalkalibacillus caeni]TLS37136.1 hotdog fold thioesterase [Pseudalkalibacillus caeni]
MNEKLVEKMKADPYANFLGIELLEVREGFAQASLVIKENMLNFNGTANGGVIFSLADYAFAAASNSHNQAAFGITVTIHYLAPGWTGERVTATVKEETKPGRLGLYRMEVTNEKEDLLAVCEGMVYRKKDTVIS